MHTQLVEVAEFFAFVLLPLFVCIFLFGTLKLQNANYRLPTISEVCDCLVRYIQLYKVSKSISSVLFSTIINIVKITIKIINPIMLYNHLSINSLQHRYQKLWQCFSTICQYLLFLSVLFNMFPILFLLDPYSCYLF